MRTLWNVWEELIQGYQTAFVPLENLYPNNASVKALLQQIVIEAALLLAPPCNTTIQSLDNGKINGGQFYKYYIQYSRYDPLLRAFFTYPYEIKNTESKD